MPIKTDPARVSTIIQLAAIPEEEIWLQKQKSARTRRTYRLDVQHFMRTLYTSPLFERNGCPVPKLLAVDRRRIIPFARAKPSIEEPALHGVAR
jgi:hypothetical protein